MRPQNKKHKTFHAQTTKNTKNKNHKKEKQTTTTNIIAIAINYYRIRVHYTVLTQHTTPTNNTQPDETQKRVPPSRSCLHKGVIYRTTSVALDTQQHAIKTKQTIKTKTQTIFALQNPHDQPATRPQEAFVSSTPTTPHAHTTHAHTRGVSHLKNRHHQAPKAPSNDEKTLSPTRY